MSNWSSLKSQIMDTLIQLEDGSADPTAFSDDLKQPYFDVVTIARVIYGDSVFTDGKLDRSRRSCLNRSLNSLHADGFTNKVGNPYRGFLGKIPDRRASMRDFGKNHFCISSPGKKMLSQCLKRGSRSWRHEYRFQGVHDIKIDRSTVKRIHEADYDWDE